MSKVIRQARITRAQVREERSTIFVFGDNLLGKGYGGQAGAMRGEPNAVGIPTKYAPDLRESSFFSDADFDRLRPILDQSFAKLKALKKYHNIVIPADGLGTGLAQLGRRAPRILAYINQKIEELGRT